MDLEILPDEIERSIIKQDKADLRKELKTGFGATTRGVALSQRYHARLAEGFRLALLDAHKYTKADVPLVILLRGLPVGVLALSCIQTILHSIGRREPLRDTLVVLGANIGNECWAHELIGRNKTFAARIERNAKDARTTKQRYQIAKDAVEKAKRYKTDPKHTKEQAKARRATARSLHGFTERAWERDDLVTAGGWLWNVVSTSLPGVFERIELGTPGRTDWALTVSEASWAIMDAVVDTNVNNNPVFWPSVQEPKPWTEYAGGGSHDERVNGVVTVLRSYHKDTQSAVKHAIASGTMKPALDALNALQAVPYVINTQVLEVLRECEGFQLDVKGITPQNLVIPKQPVSFEWDGMTEAQQRFWKMECAEKLRINLGLVSDRVLFTLDMQVADAMAQHECFYTPMNLDWRGRVYALPHFNFQREDRVRALFLFADGMPIGEDGLRWLKIHTANTGDFEKISKRSLEERVQWCDTNRQQIMRIASAPLVHTEWMRADKPFLHLAACFELSAAWEQGSSFLTRLPLSFDGSCSGLQHLSGMTRADEGRMVNLRSSLQPEDVYQKVADDTFAQIERDLLDTPDPDADDPEAAIKVSKDIRAMARLFLDYDGDRRKLVKRNVMTYSYSSKKFGMAGQQQMDLMEPLAREVRSGKRKEHPFVGYCIGPYNKQGAQQPSKAARYIAGRVFDTIETCIKKPAEAMNFLQDIAKALAHEGKPVRWTTPVGIPWINRYHASEMTNVNLYLVDGGIKERVRFNIATGSMKEIDKAKAANGVAPNAVHALDAAHLLLVSNAAAAEGIRSLATVHDSFGCLAPQAARFNTIIREQFALMYEQHDVLAEIHERASADLTDANRHRLPPLLTYGNLNLKDILNADFAFA